MSKSENIVSLEDVSVYFETGGGWFSWFNKPEVVHAVDGVSLDIQERDVVALVGESGCGKTTVGKTAIGLQRPTDGAIKYRGQDIWSARENPKESTIPYKQIRRSLQIIHQDPGSSLNGYKRIMHTLSMPLKKWEPHLSREERQARILAMLEEVGMTPPEDYAERFPHQLSGGEKQRVALIRALLMEPDLILADEAISALDVSLRIDMMDLFIDLQEQFGTSFLFISHDLSNAAYLARKAGGRIGVMYLGEIVEIGPVDEIITNPQHPYTRVLMWATSDIHDDAEKDELPMRKIDIPDPKDPPSGCRFHTRCPEARDICQRQAPDLVNVMNNHQSQCFRTIPDHEYWDSEPISED